MALGRRVSARTLMLLFACVGVGAGGQGLARFVGAPWDAPIAAASGLAALVLGVAFFRSYHRD